MTENSLTHVSLPLSYLAELYALHYAYYYKKFDAEIADHSLITFLADSQRSSLMNPFQPYDLNMVISSGTQITRAELDHARKYLLVHLPRILAADVAYQVKHSPMHGDDSPTSHIFYCY